LLQATSLLLLLIDGTTTTTAIAHEAAYRRNNSNIQWHITVTVHETPTRQVGRYFFMQLSEIKVPPVLIL
jgi:hypothetical protein